MSKANGAIEKNDTYLQHVSLKNYKSIKDVEIDFKPGLNVIIGKNASGKTNFINGLDIILNSDYGKIIDSESAIIVWVQSDKFEIQAINKVLTNEDLLQDNYSENTINHKLVFKKNDIDISVKSYDDLEDKLFGIYIFRPLLISYGIRYKENSELINIPFTFRVVNNGKISRELMIGNSEDDRTQFVESFFFRLFTNVFRRYQRNEVIPGEGLKNEIIAFSENHFKKINEIIFQYSPIKSIRLNPDFNLINDVVSQKLTVTNFYLEFLIDDSWLTFSLLSDGTKRLFYIISEIFDSDDEKQLFNNALNIILLEEPELGIHPHQLHQLMEFIKEQSKEKQIILTTHSPQVLDALEPDELDRIIICHSDPKNGTQLSHLTDQQIKKAKKYMTSEAFLSDYWRFSDLEPA